MLPAWPRPTSVRHYSAVQVDCTASSRLCTQFGSQGFPPPRLGIFNLTNPKMTDKMVFSDVKPSVYTRHFYETIALTLSDDASDFTQSELRATTTAGVAFGFFRLL